MPQSKSVRPDRRDRRPSTARKAAADVAQAPDDAVAASSSPRFLDPREVVVLTRERLQEALDEAVERGRMTRDDAATCWPTCSRGRSRPTAARGHRGPARGAKRHAQGRRLADRVLREVDRARRAAGVGPAFPILGYDDLTAAQVERAPRRPHAAELRKVRDYERRNANRKSVLAAIEQKLK